MKKLSRILFVNSLILILLLIPLELVFGSWINPKTLPHLNLVRNTVFKHDVNSLYPADQPITYSRDSWGLRGRYKNIEDIQLLTVGGSTTDQRFIDDNQTWQSVLSRALKSNGINLITANAGVDGQSTLGHIYSLRDWLFKIPGLKPEYILIYAGINDVYILGQARYDKKVFESPSALNQILLKSAVWSLFQKVKGWHYALREKAAHHRVNFEEITWTNQPLQKDHRNKWQNQITEYRKRLIILNNLIRKKGAVPIFVTQPTASAVKTPKGLYGVNKVRTMAGYPLNGVDYAILLDLYNQETLKTCRHTEAICIDLANELVFDINQDFYDYDHQSPSGTQKIGLYLAGKLKHIAEEV